MKKRKKVVGIIQGSLLALIMSGQVSTQTVLASSYDANRPVTWNQGTAPYRNQSFTYCSEGVFGPCACGVHALATILLKTEYWERGMTAEDAYAFSQEHQIGSNYQGIPAYNWEKVTQATRNTVTHTRNHWTQNNTTAHDIIRDEYAKGNFMILSVVTGGVGHLIAVDYVDEEGNIVIIDSAINAKYLTQMDNNGYVRDIQVFESATIKATEAAKFWEGEEVGKVKRGREIDALKQELNDLKELQKQEEATLLAQEAKSKKAKEVFNRIREERITQEEALPVPEVITQVFGWDESSE